MNILKKILMGMGGVFIVAIVLLVTVDNNQSNFKSQHEYFVSQFMSELADSWEVSDVRSKLSPEFLEQIGESQAQRQLSAFSALGEVKQISNVELADYMFMLDKSTNVGVFTLNTVFENGAAKVQIVLEEDGDEVKVQALNIETLNSSFRAMPARSEA